MGAIIALPKNKRGKMTVEDTVTKSSSGQIGGPALWRVSHKRRTTHSPPPPPPPALLSLRSGSHYRRGHTVERAGGVWNACQKPLVCVRPPRLMWGTQAAGRHAHTHTSSNTPTQADKQMRACLVILYSSVLVRTFLDNIHSPLHSKPHPDFGL